MIQVLVADELQRLDTAVSSIRQLVTVNLDENLRLGSLFNIHFT